MLKKLVLPIKNWSIHLKLCLFAIFAPIVLTIILYKLRTIEFATNDDPFYSFIASGSIYGFPSSELIFISKPIGLLMKFLYTLNADWPWYAMVAFATQGIAITLSLFMIIRTSFGAFAKSDVGTYIMVLVIAFLLSSIFFLKLQFTHVSILSSGIGSLLLMREKSKTGVLFSIALIVAGLLWRLEGGLLGILLTIPFFLLFLDTANAKNSIRKAFLIASVVCVASLTTYLTWSVNSPFLPPEAKEFIKFNKARGQLDGLGNYSNQGISGQSLTQVGLTENDWRLFGSWYFADPAVFTTQRLEALSENRSISKEISSLNIPGIVAVLKEIFGERLALGIFLVLFLYSIPLRSHEHRLKDGYILSFLFLSQAASYSIYWLGFIAAEYSLVLNFFSLLITFLIAYPPYKNKGIICAFSPAVISIGILLAIGILGRAPMRIIEPSLYIIFLCTTLSSIDLMQLNKKVEIFEDSKPKGGAGEYKRYAFNRKLILSILFLVILFQALVYDIRIAKSISDKNIEEYKNLNTDKPIIAFPGFYTPILSIFPLSRTSNHPTILKKLIVLGSTTRSPDYLKQIKLMGLSDDLLTSAACGDAYIGLGVDSRSQLNLIKEYLKDHYKMEISWPPEPIASFNGLEIWAPKTKKMSCK